MDSLVAELVADLMEGDDIGDEIGRKRGRKARIQRAAENLIAKRSGAGGGSSAASTLNALAASNPAAAAHVAQQALQVSAQLQARETGFPQTVGSFLAPSNQRREVLHLGFATLVAAIGSQVTLTQQTQRAVQAERLIVSVADATTGADQLSSVGIFNMTLGAHNLLSAPGIVGSATAYGATSWNADILSVPIGQGGTGQVAFQRIALTANNGVVSAVIFGASAQG